nr:hypothetical protein [Agrobacterium radiobacter]
MIPPFRRSGSKGAIIRRWRDALLNDPGGAAIRDEQLVSTD